MLSTLSHMSDSFASYDTSSTSGVLVIKYFPLDGSGTNLDSGITGINQPLSQIRSYVDNLTTQGITQMTNGTKFRGYKNNTSQPAINYQVTATKEYLIALPVSNNAIPWNPSAFRPDYNQILTKENICNYVDNQNVKQVWLWGYHHGNIEPAESNMAMGTNSQSFWNHSGYGDVSNSEQTNDMPTCKKTYTLYNYNYGRGLGEMLEDHGHQIEALFRFVDDPMWTQYQYPHGETNPAVINRCGWTHSPPNSGNWFGDRGQYDWFDKTIVKSDCEDWKPDGGGLAKDTNCNTWFEPFYSTSYTNKVCQEDGGVAFKVWWMQNIPGKSNNLNSQGKILRNWWDFYADFDAAIAVKKSLTSETPTSTPTPVPVTQVIPLYRMYLRDQGFRLWTTDNVEIDYLKQRGWINEGLAFNVYKKDQVYYPAGVVPVFRMYLRDKSLRIYTSTDAEKQFLLTRGWINEGLVFFVFKEPKPNTKPVYRLKNKADSNQRFLTTSMTEVDYLKARNWELEQIDFYVPN